MEITQQLNRIKFLSKVIFTTTQSFFFIIRNSIRLFSINEGNIVIISLLKLGDSVFTIPAIREIQNYYKKKIVIICFPESIPIFKLALIGVSFAPVAHNNFLFNERIANSKARKILKASNPEIIFDLNGVMTSATLIFTSRARLIIGMAREQFKTVYDIYLPTKRENHMMDMYLDTIAPLIPNISRELIKHFPPKDIHNRNILIQPFAGWKAKEWNLRKFIELGKILTEKYNVSIVTPMNVIGADIITEIEESDITLIEALSVDDLILHIKNCSVFIGNDSGPIHIADLLGKPTFCIYGPTNPKFSEPLGSHHEHCKIKIKCTPSADEEFCFTYGGRYGCPSFECMNTLSVKGVEKRIILFLDKIFENVSTEID
ncbi:MAG: glycosyltransferase family 9 protein [Ignavibacteriaceae bacterium]|nr:glycosyltransferase family 9 protein [Ignavibacteriaceae bacterium]